MEPEASATQAGGEERVLPRARFIDRFVAFCVDYFLILGLFYVILYYSARWMGLKAASTQFLAQWLIAWFCTFLAYMGFFTAQGRSTLGKKLVGIHVFTQEGYPLSLKAAFIRTASYLISGLLFGLGFLWALFDRQGRAWHDKIAGTMVLETRQKGLGARVATAVAAVFCFLLAAALAAYPIAAPHFARMQFQANARMGIEALARFEDQYKAQTGTYTSELSELAKLYGEPVEFQVLLSQTINLSTLQIQAGRDTLLIRAQALDDLGTTFEYRTPPGPASQSPR